MIKRATPTDDSSAIVDEQVRLIELIENALIICDKLKEHRTGAYLHEALIAATQKLEERADR